METLEDAIRRLIKQEFGSVSKFADIIDVPVTSIYSALDRGMANTRTELTDKIYRKLNIDWDTAKLDDDFRELRVKGDSESSYVDIPLYGSIAAGTPIEMMAVDDTYPVPIKMREKYPESFLLKVEGESMNRVLPNGSYALIDPTQEIKDGKAYAVCVNGYDATIKRVKQLNNGFELAPDSTDPTYHSKTYDYGKEGTEEITIIGQVVWYCIPFDWDI